MLDEKPDADGHPKRTRAVAMMPWLLAALAGALLIGVGLLAVQPADVPAAWTTEALFSGHGDEAQPDRHGLELRIPAEQGADGVLSSSSRAIVSLRPGPDNTASFRVLLESGQGEAIVDHIFYGPGNGHAGHAGHGESAQGEGETGTEETGGHDGHGGPVGAFLPTGRYNLWVMTIGEEPAHYDLIVRTSFTTTTSVSGAVLAQGTLLLPGGILFAGGVIAAVLAFAGGAPPPRELRAPRPGLPLEPGAQEARRENA